MIIFRVKICFIPSLNSIKLFLKIKFRQFIMRLKKLLVDDFKIWIALLPFDFFERVF